MTDEGLMTFGGPKRFRGRPMRGSKQIQRDVRTGSHGESGGYSGALPLYPPFRMEPSPSYR